MNDLMLFEKEEFGQVRVVMQNNEPWFVAKDVCSVLEIQNTTQALENLEDFERSMFNIGRQGKVNIINESGLYALILRSDKPKARKFRVWVTSEVLPSIRKTGTFSMPQTFPEALRAYAEEYERAEALQSKNEHYQMRLGEHEDFHKVSEDPWIVENFNSRIFGRIGVIVSDISRKMGLPIQDTPHPVVGSVSVYAKDALSAFRIMCEADDDILSEWRIK